MKIKVLAFGEVLWDVYKNSKHLGGAPMNFSAHFKKCGGEAWILTAVGDDMLGRETVCEIEKLGISTDYVSIVKQETGKCLVTLDAKHIPSYDLLNNVAYDYIQKPDISNECFDVLYFGTLALRNENNMTVLKQMLEENTFSDVFVDINIRAPYYNRDSVEFACKNATIIKISDEELPAVMNVMEKTECSAKECVKILNGQFQNLKMIIITRGDKGSLVYDCINKKYHEGEAQKVQVVSTVGAGDSFSAAFLTKYMKTDDISQALEFAAKISGYVVSCNVAIPDYYF